MIEKNKPITALGFLSAGCIGYVFCKIDIRTRRLKWAVRIDANVEVPQVILPMEAIRQQHELMEQRTIKKGSVEQKFLARSSMVEEVEAPKRRGRKAG